MSFLKIFLTEATEAAAQQGGTLDGMIDMLDSLMLIMLFGFGIYGLYSAIRLRKEQLLFPNKFLYPGNCDPAACLDPGEFIDFIIPRALILSVALILLGGLLALNSFVLHIDSWLIDLGMIVMPVAVIVWYCFVQRKAAKNFW
ncbi:MAG: hypothetical protein PUF80_00720 [Firmicutes bacterium]|nr:hypothetical protein [Bacillota bacterium]